MDEGSWMDQEGPEPQVHPGTEGGGGWRQMRQKRRKEENRGEKEQSNENGRKEE